MPQSQKPFPTEFPDPTPAELALWQNLPTGTILEIEEHSTPEDKQIRADLLVHLLTNPPAEPKIHPKGIRILGATITGNLDLENVESKTSLYLLGCTLQGLTDFRCASFPRLYFAGCKFTKFRADGSHIQHGLTLSDGCVVQEEATLNGATIGDQLDLSGTHFQSITADRIKVSGSIALHSQAYVTEHASFIGARIDGRLNCSTAQINTLDLTGAAINQSVFINEGYTSNLTDLSSTKIGGSIEGQDATVGNLLLNYADIHLGIELGKGFHSPGLVSAFHTHCGGSFDVTDAKVNILNANGITIQADLFLQSGFRAEGQVSLHGATIKGLVSFIEASFQKMELESISVGGHLILRDGTDFTALNLVGSHIGGSLIVKPINVSKERLLLAAVAATIEGSAYIELPPDSHLDLDHAKIQGSLTLTATEDCSIELKQAQAGAFSPSRSTLKSFRNHWVINGFTYTAFHWPDSNAAPDTKEISDFLQRTDEGRMLPQPYQQMIKALTLQGHEDEAVEIAVSARRAHRIERSSTDSTLFSKLAVYVEYLILDLALGYGYRPQRSVWITLSVVVFAGIIYTATGLNMMAPAQADILSNWVNDYPTGYPDFVPFIYALDRTLPIIDLGQVSYFQPNMDVSKGSLLMAFDWILNITGWVLTSLIVAAFSGIVKNGGSDSLSP